MSFGWADAGVTSGGPVAVALQLHGRDQVPPAMRKDIRIYCPFDEGDILSIYIVYILSIYIVSLALFAA